MRKIKNGALVSNAVNNFYRDLLLKWKTDNDAPLPKLKKILESSNMYLNITSDRKKEYLELLIAEFEKIIAVTPDKIAYYQGLFDAIIPSSQISTEFFEDIVLAMQYKKLRKEDFPALYLETGLKTCVYCHSLFTLVVNTKFYKINVNGHSVGDVRRRKAMFELDHFHAKSSYPFLCISFYNLFPSCANCNKAKSFKPSKFNLYTSGKVLDDFQFTLNDASIVKYWSSRDINDIKIDFNHLTGTLEERNEFNEMFGISFIYDTQKDIVEELLYKKEVYSKGYKDILRKNFKKLFPDESVIKRLLLGNYYNPDDVHKRPLAKFMQDIAMDIKLFKKI